MSVFGNTTAWVRKASGNMKASGMDGLGCLEWLPWCSPITGHDHCVLYEERNNQLQAELVFDRVWSLCAPVIDTATVCGFIIHVHTLACGMMRQFRPLTAEATSAAVQQQS